MSGFVKKCTIENENRAYQDRWENECGKFTNNKGKLQCLVCMQVLSVPKECNVKRHYSTMYEVKYQAYLGEPRIALIRDFRTKLKLQTNMFSRNIASSVSFFLCCFSIARKSKESFY